MTQNRGSEALPEEATELRQKENVSYGKKEIEEKEELKERVGESVTSTDLPSSSVHTMEPNLETLDDIPSSFAQHQSSVLQGSPTTLNLDDKVESKETAGPPEKEIIAREAAQTPPPQAENQLQVSVCSTPFSEKEIIPREAAQTPPSQAENQLQVSVCSTPFSELSPNSVTQSLSSVPSSTIRMQKMSRPTHMGEVGKNYPSGGKALSPVSVARTSASDGFNWRKYGQKQVKSPTGSRSYYRCTHSNCCAKKIECCDHLGHVIEIVYRSEHSHDPPRKTTSIKESKSKPSNEPTAENSVSEKPIRVPKDSDLFISSEAQQEAHSTDKKQENSSSNDGNGKFILKEEHLDKPEPKRRKEKSELNPSDSSVKPEKKPKLVVHAAGDVGISGDGYRWRKYGQKMVKGNPHPRNYYRCTSAGCPVRKHIETAVDNSNAVIITYKGVHDHDMPVPKKRHGPPSAPLVAAAAPASMNNLQLTKPESPQNHKTSTKWSVGTEGELTGEAMDLSGEKAIESARTLLSIGFEIKPC